MEAPPKKKMSTMRAVMMLGVALIISTIILVFSTLPVSAPLLIGSVTTAVVAQHTGSTLLGKIAGDFAGVSAGAAEVFTGVGVAAVSTVGEVVADSLEFFALVLFFPLWYLLSGIKQFGGKHAVHRFFISMVSLIIGVIPVLNILPTVLIGVSLVIMSVRKEDAEEERGYEERVGAMRLANFATQRENERRTLVSMQMAQRQRAIHDTAPALG